MVRPDQILEADVDVLAPCAMGAIINDKTVDAIRAPVVAGSANNQLAAPEHGDRLAERGVLYVPDYAINAGGIIDVSAEYYGYDAAAVRSQLDNIGFTLDEIFSRSASTGRPAHRVADAIAEERLAAARTPASSPTAIRAKEAA